MTFDDNNAAVELMAETMGSTGKLGKTKLKLQMEYAGRQKKTAGDQQALVFANSLMTCGGTFEFTQQMRDFGYSTVWEAMAGELHEPAAKPMQKAANVSEWSHVYQNGCYALQAKLTTQWDDVVIYMVPRVVNGLLIEVITINPDHVVNKDGHTAYQIWSKREKKRVTGQIKAAAVKLVRATSHVEALNLLKQETDDKVLLEYVSSVKKGTLENALEGPKD